MIGRTLDRYRIDGKLGEGGMGVVYQARDLQLDRTVAIKVLPHDRVADPVRKQRFIQEAKAASALNHPGIVTVFDIGADAGVDFIVMEYAAGRTLDQLIAARGLGLTQALRLGVQIADALAAAHGAGIVHRDVKPSNVIVTDEGRVKVLDFGLAKLFDSGGPAEARTQTAALTEAGMVVGTVAYMSPEQAEGRMLDGRSDIFSFGAVLFEMVTGRRPFVADSPLSVLAKILNEDPPAPSTIIAGVPAEVERAILRCLRKDPARRFQTMADLKVALEDLAADSSSGAGAPSAVGTGPRGRRWLWAALVPVILGVAYLASRSWPSPETAEPLHAVPLTSSPGVKRSPSFSPDGNQVAFTWTGPTQDNTDVYVQQIGAGAPLRLTTDPAADYSPVWSPDGRAIAFLRPQADATRHDLRLIPPLGGPERKLTEVRVRGNLLRDVSLAWCPDSSCVVVSDSPRETTAAALFVVSTESGEKRSLTAPQAPAIGDTDPAISPDGKWLVFRRDVSPFTGELYRLALGSGPTAVGEPYRLTPTALFAYNPRWLPGSTEVVFSARGRLWRLGISGDRPAERLPIGEDGLTPVASTARPGRPARLVYVRSLTDTNIWRVVTAAPRGPAASPPRAVIASTRSDAAPQFAPDGHRVAFTSSRSGEHEIWVADVDGSNAVQITAMAANPGFPRWSPDGRTIAFHSNPDGQAEIFVVPADGGRPQNLSSNPSVDAFPSFSRDGRWIYFNSLRSGQSSIWKMPATGGAAVQVSPDVLTLAIESMDGASLYYGSGQAGQPGALMRLPLAGGTPIALLEGVISTSFDVIDGGIHYVERVGGDSRLAFFDFTSGKTTVLARNLGTLGFGLAASPDGSAVLYARVDSSVDDLMLVENFR